MKIKAYQGMNEVKNFSEWLTLEHVKEIIQQNISGVNFGGQYFNSSERPAAGKKQKNNGGDAIIKAVENFKLELVDVCESGKLFSITKVIENTKRPRNTDWESAKSRLLTALDAFQESFESLWFEIVGDNDQPSTIIIDSRPVEILRNLSYPKFNNISKICGEKNRKDMQIEAQKAKSPELPCAITRSEALWDEPIKKWILEEEWVHGTDFDAIMKYVTDAEGNINYLWIPNRIPLVLFDTEEITTYYEQVNGAWEARAIEMNVNNNEGVPRPVPLLKEIAFYHIELDPKYAFDAKGGGLSIKEKDLVLNCVSKPPNWPKDGIGGGGAARCDRPEEHDFFIDDRDGTIATALGMKSVAIHHHPANAKTTLDLEFPWKDSSGNRCSVKYYKEFKAGSKNKKNRPRDTIPLLISLQDFASQDKFVTKKRKGGDFELLKGKPGVNIKPPTKEREDAGSVMKAYIKSKSLLKSPGSSWTGSANTLCELVFANDSTVEDYWNKKSDNLLNQNSKPAGDSLKKKLRTDQEWCHLVGHGDGGEEVGENFVSGSKHCNTEQLALEIVQRRFRGLKNIEISVKVTAYLMPQTPQLVVGNVNNLKRIFPQIFDNYDPSKVKTPDDMEKFRSTLESYFGEYLNSGNQKDRATVNGTKITVTTKTDYDACDDSGKDRMVGTLVDQVVSELFFVFPIARKMKYRVFVHMPLSGKIHKAISHVYNAQREEIDYNEFRILEWYFTAMIYAAMDQLNKDASNTMVENFKKKLKEKSEKNR